MHFLDKILGPLQIFTNLYSFITLFVNNLIFNPICHSVDKKFHLISKKAGGQSQNVKWTDDGSDAFYSFKKITNLINAEQRRKKCI